MHGNRHTPQGDTPPGTIILWYILIFIGLTMVTAHPGGGYVILLSVLLQATVASVVLIVLPLLGPCGPA